MKKSLVCSLALAASLCLIACGGLQKPPFEPAPLRPDASVVTVINLLEAPAGSQGRLIELLDEGIGGKMRHLPGFVSATIHKSLDSQRVVVYAQWASEQALADASRFTSEGGAPAMLEAFELGAAEVNTYAIYAQVEDANQISPDRDVLTVFNVLSPSAAEQENVAALLKEGIGGKMRHLPGFVSATIHKSLDSQRVVVYAQWASEQALADASRFTSEGGAPAMLEAFELGAAEVNTYAVVVVHRAPPG